LFEDVRERDVVSNPFFPFPSASRGFSSIRQESADNMPVAPRAATTSALPVDDDEEEDDD
jgi:hypothetical protein